MKYTYRREALQGSAVLMVMRVQELAKEDWEPVLVLNRSMWGHRMEVLFRREVLDPGSEGEPSS